MKVLLAYRARLAVCTGDQFLSALPVGLGIMSAVLKAEGIDAKVANFSTDSWDKIRRFLLAERADIVALSVFTHNRFAARKLALLVKKMLPDCWVICGGPHASQAAEDVLSWPGVDVVAIGEGEESLRELALYRRDAILCKEIPRIPGMVRSADAKVDQILLHRPPLIQLDDLPFAHHGLHQGHGIDCRRQAEYIITSRGCPAACVFCSSPGFWGRKLRYRSATSVLAELRSLRDELGLLYFSIRDDTFTSDRQRVIEFCQRLVAEELYIVWNCQSRVTAVDDEMLQWLKRGGCECIQFGIESGSPRILKALGKQITRQQIETAVTAARKVGLQVSVYLIAGVPGETLDDVAETESLLNAVLPHDGQVAPLAYYPGTVLFSRAVAAGLVTADHFNASPAEALYVRSDPFVNQATQRLISCLRRVGKKASYRKADYRAQKRLLGYCHATNLQAGDMYAGQGQWEAAQREYAEIVEREPRNPWGWLALGELALERELLDESLGYFEKVHQLVPQHLPALLALAEVTYHKGDDHGVRQWMAAAEALAPGDVSVAALRRHLSGIRELNGC